MKGVGVKERLNGEKQGEIKLCEGTGGCTVKENSKNMGRIKRKKKKQERDIERPKAVKSKVK